MKEWEFVLGLAAVILGLGHVYKGAKDMQEACKREGDEQ
jgi:hypothetical protein